MRMKRMFINRVFTKNLIKRSHHEGMTLKPSYEYIKVEVKGNAGLITLNRPKALNGKAYISYNKV